MFCSNCGKKLEDEWIKCPYCSAEVEMQYRNKTDQTEAESTKGAPNRGGENIKDEPTKAKTISGDVTYLGDSHNRKNNESSGGYHTVLGDGPPIVKKYLGWGMKTLRIIAMFIIAVLIIIGPFTVSSFGTTIDFFIALAQYYSIVVFIVVVPVLLIFNTRGIRDKLPLFKKRKAPTTLLAILLTYILLSMVLGIILDGSDLLHTKAYHDEIQEQTLAEKKAEEEAILAKEREQIAKKAAKDEKAKKAAEEEAAKKVAEEEAAAKKAAEEEEAAKKAAEEEAAAKKAAEEEAAAKKAAEEETARKVAEEEKNHIPTELEQIQASLDAAEVVKSTDLMRNPISYEGKYIGVKDYVCLDAYGNPYFYILGEIVNIKPKTIIDEQGNAVENLLLYDKLIVVGYFHYNNCIDELGIKSSSIENAIVVLMN